MPQTVYVVNHSGYSYERAKPYGEPIYMSKGFVEIDQYEAIRNKFQSLIETASPDDYLLLSGNSLLCVMAFDTWIKIHSKCNVLHWSQDKDAYVNYEFVSKTQEKVS